MADKGKLGVDTVRSKSEYQQLFGGLPKAEQPEWWGFEPDIAPWLQKTQDLDEVLKASLDAKEKIHAQIQYYTEQQGQLDPNDFIGAWIFKNKIGGLHQRLARMDATSAIGAQEGYKNYGEFLTEQKQRTEQAQKYLQVSEGGGFPAAPGAWTAPNTSGWPPGGGISKSVTPASAYGDNWISASAASEGSAQRREENLFWNRVLGEQGAEGAYQASKFPMPSWLAPLLEPSMMAGKAPKTKRGTETGAAFTPRPLGAQAELTPTQMQQLALYGGWGQGGATLDPDEYIKNLSQVAPWWEEYSTLSKKLAPKSVNLSRPQWSVKN